MPSGSKKRKAAKKRKEQVTNNVKSSINNNPYGHDDIESQDKRDSDGSDVGSPASMDDHNNHQHMFNHSEDERKRAPSHVTEEKSMEEAARDVKRTEKHGLDDVETTHVRIQHVEHEKSSSCSSSSDEESRAFKKKSKEEAYNVGSEVTSNGNEDKSATVMSEGVPKVAENGTHRNVNGNSDTVTSANKSVSNVISKVELKGNEEKVFPYTSTPPSETHNVVEKTRDSEPHDHSKKQPLVAPTPPMEQRTSLLSCCGLLDVLTGSGR